MKYFKIISPNYCLDYKVYAESIDEAFLKFVQDDPIELPSTITRDYDEIKLFIKEEHLNPKLSSERQARIFVNGQIKRITEQDDGITCPACGKNKKDSFVLDGKIILSDFCKECEREWDIALRLPQRLAFQNSAINKALNWTDKTFGWSYELIAFIIVLALIFYGSKYYFN